MKTKFSLFLLAVQLILAGCTTISEQGSIKGHNLGTIPENISTGDGWFSVVDDFVYTAEFGDTAILEYDLSNGNTIEISLPGQEKAEPGATSISRAPRFFGSMFLLKGHIAFVDNQAVSFQYETEEGKKQWVVRDTASLVVLDPVDGEYTKIAELGEQVFKVIPVLKTATESTQEIDFSEENPLAGVELYYYFGYDSFPEMAEQMAQLGMTLEEPVDPNERNQYVVPALGYMDGDTGKTEILARDITSSFLVDDQYVYYLSGDFEAGTRKLRRSKRGEHAFETIDLGCSINSCIASYDGGFYFCRLPEGTICYYKDGQIADLPIASTSFKRWRDQIIYLDNGDTMESYGSLKAYNLISGEIRVVCDGASFDFHILGDKYLGYIQYTDEALPHILIDLETGNQIELCRTE